ncbi:MAG TPA: Ppx/GppA phosphatase family protein [Candidatus Aquilonibacter sp.]|jgi:exopolyphosphatase/guanosine-5'-triphosphate,3'-diphosphate pyrophosphatase|nr:Ppx/GppA phosphatase family protein [Candidatus Aquilonibacter sp.]
MPTFAAVDIGSNSVRLKIARLTRGHLRSIHEDREVTRLGEGVFRSGFLTPESMAETVKVLRRFHRATQQVVTDPVRVVATSALRDARNSQAFLEWVRSATGWTVEIISGLEEARLIHLGLVSNLRADNAPTLMMDLGGGSCELTVSARGHIRETVSLPLGAVRLTDEFLRHDPPRKGEIKRLQGFIAREVNRIAPRIVAAKVKTVIATSGTADALATAASGLRKNGSRQRPGVSHAEMTRLAKRLARLPVEERRKIEGIGLRRAEIVVAGAMVYQELLDRCHLKGFRYSPLGLRDGLLAQMAAEHDGSTRSGKQIESERWESITRAVEHYRVDMRHALDVRESAMFLFSALHSVHGLAPEFREWLSAAAMLYEVGDYVNRNGHHRHTHYILSNSEILGYTPQQRRLIAAIARYLGKSRPTLEDAPMKALDPAERAGVQKAIMLLRLARALHLGRTRAVQKVRVSHRGGEVHLTLVPRRRMGVDLELWAIEKDAPYFREVFGRELSIAAV